MGIRCKFKAVSKTIFADYASVELIPVSTGSEENKNFYKYTPGGKINFDVINKAVSDDIIPGNEYYIDITDANNKKEYDNSDELADFEKG